MEKVSYVNPLVKTRGYKMIDVFENQCIVILKVLNLKVFILIVM